MKTEKRRSALCHLVDGAVNCVVIAAVATVGAVQLNSASSARFGVIVTAVAAAVGILVSVLLKAWVLNKTQQTLHQYIGILDTIPFMLHATDMDMNWIFMNKATEDFLGLDRDEVMGKHCSNWNAEICNTDRCSAYCLRNGNPTTFFAQNDMDLRVDTNWLTDNKKNRIGYVEVVQDISTMVELQKKQARLVAEINRMCHSFVLASSEISQGAEALAQGSAEQTASVEELSAAISQVTKELRDNMEQTQQAASFAADILEDAEAGSQQMEKMTQAVDEISEASQAIGKVINVIDNIAFQTNILALNASVEAARAGSQGKGFAVVAEEVRNLATKSAQAAKETHALIANSIQKAALGTKISGETAVSFSKIITGIHQSSEVVDNIARSASTQSDALVQIDAGIERVAMVVQQNSAFSQESAATSEEMHSRIQTMQDMLDDFDEETRYTGDDANTSIAGFVQEQISAAAPLSPMVVDMALEPNAAGSSKYY